MASAWEGAHSPLSWGDIIFEYAACDTCVHRLDPRTKILWLTAVTALAIFLHDPLLLFSLFLLSLLPFALGRPQRGTWLRIVAFYLFIFVGTTLSQGFFSTHTGGAEPLFWLIAPDTPVIGVFTGGVAFTLEGAAYGFVQAFRIISMLNASLTLVLTTPLNRVILGLSKFGLPPLLAFMITTAVRFVPTVFDEWRMILTAQRARGIPITGRKLIEYSLSPLILSSIRRCNQLALAAESRAFGAGVGRSAYGEIACGPADRYCMGAVAVVTGLLIAAGYWGV